MDKIPMTVGGHKALTAEFEHRTANERRRIIDAIARQMGADLRCADVPTIHIDLRRIGAWSGRRTTIDAVDRTQPSPAAGQAVLAGWHTLLDDGRLQDGEPHLAGTARPPVARLAPSTAAEAGVGAGDRLRVSTAEGGAA